MLFVSMTSVLGDSVPVLGSLLPFHYTFFYLEVTFVGAACGKGL